MHSLSMMWKCRVWRILTSFYGEIYQTGPDSFNFLGSFFIARGHRSRPFLIGILIFSLLTLPWPYQIDSDSSLAIRPDKSCYVIVRSRVILILHCHRSRPNPPFTLPWTITLALPDRKPASILLMLLKYSGHPKLLSITIWNLDFLCLVFEWLIFCLWYRPCPYSQK